MPPFMSSPNRPHSRKPQLLTFRGQFVIDEHYLRSKGETDFAKYAVDPTQPLTNDLFVDDSQVPSKI